jgi:ABC-type xylose transport system permease subunit
MAKQLDFPYEITGWDIRLAVTICLVLGLIIGIMNLLGIKISSQSDKVKTKNG